MSNNDMLINDKYKIDICEHVARNPGIGKNKLQRAIKCDGDDTYNAAMTFLLKIKAIELRFDKNKWHKYYITVFGNQLLNNVGIGTKVSISEIKSHTDKEVIDYLFKLAKKMILDELDHPFQKKAWKPTFEKWEWELKSSKKKLRNIRIQKEIKLVKNMRWSLKDMITLRKYPEYQKWMSIANEFIIHNKKGNKWFKHFQLK